MRGLLKPKGNIYSFFMTLLFVPESSWYYCEMCTILLHLWKSGQLGTQNTDMYLPKTFLDFVKCAKFYSYF